MGIYFASQHAQLQCPLCGKFVQAAKKYRHGHGCFYTNKLAGAIYSWYQFDKKYICMICGQGFKVLTELTSHSLEHEQTDVEAMGMSRFMLGRNCKDMVDGQTHFMQKKDPAYRLRSRKFSTVFSQLPGEALEYMSLVNQRDCYGAVVGALYPTAPPVSPPSLPGQWMPYLFSQEPYEQHSFRIKTDWLDAVCWPIHNII